MGLKHELARLSYAHDVETFHELLMDRFAEMFPGATVDEMLCHEHAPRRFVKDIRLRSGVASLDHSLILRTLLKIRKGGGSPLRSPCLASAN